MCCKVRPFECFEKEVLEKEKCIPMNAQGALLCVQAKKKKNSYPKHEKDKEEKHGLCIAAVVCSTHEQSERHLAAKLREQGNNNASKAHC